MEKLTRTTQCKNCPWKVSANLDEIPNYELKQHKALKKTISEGSNDFTQRPVMSCHESEDDQPQACIGYLHNQLNQGNNIMLRLQVRDCPNIGEIKVVGKQVDNFKQTFHK